MVIIKAIKKVLDVYWFKPDMAIIWLTCIIVIFLLAATGHLGT